MDVVDRPDGHLGDEAVEPLGLVDPRVGECDFEEGPAGGLNGLDLDTDYGVGTNVGGGVKIDVAGPLRVRVDYRVFKLVNPQINDKYHRFYVGANLAF